MSDWCILRCAGSRTMALAASLTDAGIRAWTPIETRERRIPRKAARETVQLPITPSFVFAASERLSDLLTLARSPSMLFRVWDSEKRRMVTKGHPTFSVFRSDGRVPVVSEQSLAPLRKAEHRTMPRKAAKIFRKGEIVSTGRGGFAGLQGHIEASQGQYAMVVFPGFPIAVKIATWMLDEDSPVNVEDDQSEQAPHAKAA